MLSADAKDDALSGLLHEMMRCNVTISQSVSAPHKFIGLGGHKFIEAVEVALQVFEQF